MPYIKTFKPYGYIRNDLVIGKWQFRGQFFIRDRVANKYEIDEKTYKEIKND